MEREKKQLKPPTSTMVHKDSLTATDVDKLIPQIFDQMRSNLGMHSPMATSKTRNRRLNSSSEDDALKADRGSVLTTQSMLREKEMLDKMIGLIESIDERLQTSLPSHFSKILEVCKSTNLILDSWTNIQSQAGFVYELMDNKTYLRELTGELAQGRGIHRESLVNKKKHEIQSIQREIEKLENKPSSGGDNVRKTQNLGSGLSRRPNRPGIVSKTNGVRPRPSGIPSISDRLARPTVSSSRKMFK